MRAQSVEGRGRIRAIREKDIRHPPLYIKERAVWWHDQEEIRTKKGGKKKREKGGSQSRLIVEGKKGKRS